MKQALRKTLKCFLGGGWGWGGGGCNQPCFKTCKKKKVRNQSMKNEKERKKEKTF